jgi:hypothetical protein
MPVVVVARAVRHGAVDVVRRTTRPASSSRSTISSRSGTGASRTSTVGGPGRRGTPAAATGRLHRHGLGRYALVVPGGLTEDDGAAAARTLLELSDPRAPTAVTVFNDRCATGVLDVLRVAGVAVPGDMSVVGSTTAAWRGSPTSTSPRSPRTPRR